MEGGRLRAYKFTRPGAIGRFSGFAWPRPDASGPGAWVEAAPSICATGVHACAVVDLAYWIDAELWEVELGGTIERGRKKLVADRGRLVRQVEGWEEASVSFAAACRRRVDARARTNAELAPFREDVPLARPASAAFVAARVAELDAGADAYAAEREWQALWLAERLAL